MVTKPTLKIKRKKKRWVSVLAPAVFQNVQIAESYVQDAVLLKGRSMALNLMTVTNNPKRQNMRARFFVDSIVDGKAHTRLVGYSLLPSSIKRVVRRNRDKVTDSFTAKTKEGTPVRIKPMIITNGNTYKNVQKKIRAACKEILTAHLAKQSFDDIVSELVDFKLQKLLRDQLNKLYPVKVADIRSFEVLPEAIKEE